VVGLVHGEWRSGEGIKGAAARRSEDTAERALAQADLATASKPRWLATPVSREPPRRLPHYRGRATPGEGEGGCGGRWAQMFCAKPRKWG
jgi:hypothetical protein